MTVFFDHQAFCIQEYGGLSRYYTELIAGLQQSDDVTPLLPLRYANNRHLQDAGLHNRPFFANQKFRGKQRFLHAINRWNDITHIRTQPFDVFHATYYNPYFLPYLNGLNRKVPLVITFLDMIHEKLSHQFPELAQDKAIVKQKRLLADRADRLIAVSESTKRDVVEILNVDPDKIDVIYHGSSFALSGSSAQREAVQDDKSRYLLFVGRRGGYKNFDGMLRGIAPLLKREKMRLICAGGGPFTSDESSIMQLAGVSGLIRQQSATDVELRQLYGGAFAFIFPSLYEGFGIPILEAMACGCPCILSNQSSLPEIGGNAALYFDTENPDSLATQVYDLMAAIPSRHELIECGYKQVERFLWSAAVNQTTNLYFSVYNAQQYQRVSSKQSSTKTPNRFC